MSPTYCFDKKNPYGNKLDSLAMYNSVSVFLVPGHSGVTEIESTDAMIRVTSNARLVNPEPSNGLSKSLTRQWVL